MVLKHGYCQIDRLLDRFVITLRSMGRSPATVRAYRATVSRYAAFAVHVPDELDPVARYVATRRTRDHLKRGSAEIRVKMPHRTQIILSS